VCLAHHFLLLIHGTVAHPSFLPTGTCVSTLAPSCYSSYTQYQDLFDFLQTTIDLRDQYDIYSALTSAGITPSSSKTYKLSALKAATQQAFGYAAAFQCSSGAISEVWIPFHTSGRSTSADGFEQINPPYSMDTCSSSAGIKWLPK
jgi:ribonuclease T2